MIFVTVGSHPTFKFQRLIDALDAIREEELVVQHGPADPPRNASVARPWLSFDEVLEYMTQASVIITHAGVGTILTASNLGRIPIVVPRLKRFAETVDDHQLELAQMLERTGQVVVAWDVADIVELGRAHRVLVPSGPQERQALNTAVHEALIAA
jgi:UDP-N-acetylglucosamine transferase subunit ALG13